MDRSISFYEVEFLDNLASVLIGFLLSIKCHKKFYANKC